MTPAGSTGPASARDMWASISCLHLIESLQARAAAGEIKGRISSRRYHPRRAAPMRRDSVPRSRWCICRSRISSARSQISGVRRRVADRDHVPGMASQPRLRGWRLARAELRTRSIRLGTAGRGPERELHGGRRRLARQEPGRVAAQLRSSLRKQDPYAAAIVASRRSLTAFFQRCPAVVRGPCFRRDDNEPHTGSAIEYFTWLSAKLDSIEAMPSSRVSLFFRNAS